MLRKTALLLIVACILLPVLGPAPAAAQSAADLDIAAIDAYAQAAMKQARIPGLALAVVDSQGIRYSQAYGTAGQGRPLTTQTPLYIGSISKPFTAMAIHQLAQEGKLDLQAPVQAYIPWFAMADAGQSAKIKIIDLLNQVSGIPQREGNTLTYYIDPATTREELVRQLKGVRPNHPIGTYEYSNFNYIVLGYVIEQVSGQAYADYVQERILNPAGLAHTFLDEESAIADGMSAHYKLLFGQPVPWREPYRPALQASGLIISSVEDMARFAMLYLNKGWSGDTPVLPGHGRDEVGYYDIYWGWYPTKPIVFTAFHGGALDTANSYMMIKAGQDLGVVVLLNVRPDSAFPNVDAAQIAEAVAAIAQGKQPEPLDDRGFAANLRAANMRTFGIMLVLPVSLLAAALTLKGRPARSKAWRITFWCMALLEIAAALQILISVPLQTGVGWPVLLRGSPDYMGANLTGAVLFAVAGVVTALAAGKRVEGLRQLTANEGGSRA